jgi:3-oxoacyl-(acyl-carrier-protein) synthase
MPQLAKDQRIVITGIGLAAPNADNLQDYRSNLLAGKSGIREIELRYVGKVPAPGQDASVYMLQMKPFMMPVLPVSLITAPTGQAFTLD